MLRNVFYGDVEPTLFQAYAHSLTPDLPLDFFQAAAQPTRSGWGRVARTFLRTGQDEALTPVLQDKMIAEADAWTPGNRFQVLQLNSSHSPFASQPEELARLLAEVAG